MKQYSHCFTLFFLLVFPMLTACNDDDEVISSEVLVASAGDDRSAKVDDEIMLDGSGSYAKDDKAFFYSWSIITKPLGSQATLQNPTSVRPTLKPDKSGHYSIQLRIVRNNLSSTDELRLTVAPNDPEGPNTIILNEDISENTTLDDVFADPSQPDYRVTADIAVRADLVILPGVVVEFEQNTGLEILTGSLIAKGVVNKRITLRGAMDQPGFWKGVVIYTNSDQNEMDYVTIRHGGSSVFSPSNTQANVALAGTTISGAALKVNHTSFSESGGYGLYLHGMSALNHFSDNRFESNVLAAAYIPAGQLHQLDRESFIDDNNQLQIVETGGPVSSDGQFIWKNLWYVVSQDINISAGISIDAGAYFSFENDVTLSVSNNGFLNATGTEGSRITFTSFDPNGYWNGLYFNSLSEQNNIQFSEISNAGAHRIADSEREGNIVIGHTGLLRIENSIIKNGLGYGISAKSISSINTNVIEVNTFINLQKGAVFPIPTGELPSVNGVWLDQWSFNRNADDIVGNLYDRNSGTWFGGAANPWAMPNASFGIRFEENGQFIWAIAEHSPMTGCESYSAEFITGQANVSSGTITFEQDYWRSKFVNKCDESQNVDTDVTPTEFVLPYTITKMYNILTGEQYWELKLINPDNSTFSLYRR